MATTSHAGVLPKDRAQDEPLLAPAEKPQGLFMRFAYYLSRLRYGKVLMPLKVMSGRLPSAFARFYGKVSELDRKLVLPAETALLIREQVARINVCHFCMDIGRWNTMQASMNPAKFDALEQYRSSSLFNDAERAVLDYVTDLTKYKKVDPGTFSRMAAFYSEREICEIVWLVASEHLYNVTNIGLNIRSDMLCEMHRQAAQPLGQENAAQKS